MLDITQDIHSLTDFKRNTGEFIDQMKESGRPVVLTINGKAELVVQDAASYQRLVERLEAIEGIREGLAQMKQGKTRAARVALEGIRRKHGIPR